MTFTYPELGNTGVNPEDEESHHPHVRGVIARNVCSQPSSWRMTQSLSDYLKHHGIPGIFGIDTRALTRQLRDTGVMNGAISTEILDPDELLRQLQAVPAMTGLNLVSEVTTTEPYEWSEPTATVWECFPELGEATRSEEHTSELQSRPHISYAVFCLKKKNQKKKTNTPSLSAIHSTGIKL